MKRLRPVAIALAVAGLVVLVVATVPVGAKPRAHVRKHARAHTTRLLIHRPLCESRSSLCADTYDIVEGSYVGHDEPSVLFKSDVPGSGNDITFTVKLPHDPAAQPTPSGEDGTPTWNFQLRPTFWFSNTLCDSQSAPEFTHECHPNTDANNLVGADPGAPNYIGKHVGTAFLELQFYGPGYVPQFEGFGCTAHQYCAAMTIDSRTLDQNTGVFNTAACNEYLLGGQEPINWAYITRSGHSQAPADPLFTGTFTHPNFSAVDPNPSQDLFMNPDDTIRIHMHDTPAGYRVDMTDLTTGQSGSMTASVANGFAHVLYTPDAHRCRSAPYAFHPAYSTANPRGNTWSAHTYNVAMSDEIGHFENCLEIDSAFNCVKPGSQDRSGIDPDDQQNFCVPGSDSTLVHIDGCFFADEDFDGQSYRPDWPGTNPNPVQDQVLHPSPLLFTSPVTGGHTNYSRIAFETDLPRIEAEDSQFNPPFCNRTTGAHCVNPPLGAKFYPFFTTGTHGGGCVWQEGGNFIPGTTNHFGGSSTAEFGPLLKSLFPGPGFTPLFLIDNFNSGNQPNPCPTG